MLVVAGDHDQSPLSTRGPDWFTDADRSSPGDATLRTVFDGEHSLGGINGYLDARTTGEDPRRVELVLRAAGAWLGAKLDGDAAGWDAAVASLADDADRLGPIESW